MCVSAILWLPVIIGGCQTPLTQYERMDADASLSTMAQRQSLIETIEAIGTVVLAEQDGDEVRLDTAMVAQLPDRLRLRAWKFDRAVFDVTLIDGAVWLYQTEKNESNSDSNPLSNAGVGLAFLLEVLGGEFYESAHVDSMLDSKVLVARGSIREQQVVCSIDRRTLTAREFAADGDASQSWSVQLNDYRMIDLVPWPYEIVVQSPDGRFELHFHEAMLNSELSSSAFTPPPGAVVQP